MLSCIYIITNGHRAMIAFGCIEGSRVKGFEIKKSPSTPLPFTLYPLPFTLFLRDPTPPLTPRGPG